MPDCSTYFEGVRVADPWFVLTTHANDERRARYELDRQGFPVYLPMRSAKNRERLRHWDLPLFPGYIFAQPRENGQWSPMRSTLGVRKVLLNGEVPATIADEIIAQIRVREAEDFDRARERELLKDELPCPFEPGDDVQIEYVGRVVRAIFAEREARNRVSVMLSLLGREVRATVDLRQLRAAE